MTDKIEMSEDLRAAVLAVDSLNSWVRSKSFTGQSPSLRRWVYHLKKAAMKQVHAACPKLMKHDRVAVIAKCTKCREGKYYDYEGECRGDCYRCHGKGMLILYFVQTRLYSSDWAASYNFASIAEWHTPRMNWDFLPGAEPLTDWPNDPVGWSPNTVGKDMSIADAARALIVAEKQFNLGSKWHTGEDWNGRYSSYWETDDSQYHLNLGWDKENCYRCGAVPAKDRPFLGAHSYSGRVEFVVRFCDDCNKELGRDVFRQPIPLDLLVADSIREWIALHPEEAKEPECQHQ